MHIPANAASIIVFSQTGRDDEHRSRSRLIAAYLEKAGLTTLLPDLFSPDERQGYGITFDLDLLTRRLVLVTEWLKDRDLFGHYHLTFYGTGMGAAAALKAAGGLRESIGAIVCVGGRPNLAEEALPIVNAPTLLIIGELNRYVLQLNREALDRFSCDCRLEVIAGTAHTFQEGKMQEAASLASS